jgi:hypothetical protein
MRLQLVEFYSQKLKTGSTIEARIQFEGYPAIQFVGWPSIAVGTFGGKVMAVDAHDDGKGKFRVLIEHDENDKAWPSDFALRQGSLRSGLVVAGKVSLGYELWRRFTLFRRSWRIKMSLPRNLPR